MFSIEFEFFPKVTQVRHSSWKEKKKKNCVFLLKPYLRQNPYNLQEGYDVIWLIIQNKGVCRTAPATPGLLIISSCQSPDWCTNVFKVPHSIFIRFSSPPPRCLLKKENFTLHYAALQSRVGRFHFKGPRKKLNAEKCIFFMKCER